MSNLVPLDAVVADPKRPWKAYLAFAGMVIGTVWASLAGRETLDDMTLMEWLSIIVPTILTTIAVYTVENPKVVGPQVRDERGAVDILMVVVLVVLAVLILLAVFGFLR